MGMMRFTSSCRRPAAAARVSSSGSRASCAWPPAAAGLASAASEHARGHSVGTGREGAVRAVCASVCVRATKVYNQARTLTTRAMRLWRRGWYSGSGFPSSPSVTSVSVPRGACRALGLGDRRGGTPPGSPPPRVPRRASRRPPARCSSPGDAPPWVCSHRLQCALFHLSRLELPEEPPPPPEPLLSHHSSPRRMVR